MYFNNSNANKFRCIRAGIYLFFYTVVWINTDDALFKLSNENRKIVSQINVQVEKILVSYQEVSTSRSNILNLTARQELTLFSEYPTFGDETTGSSWCAFKIDSIMSPLIVFDMSVLMKCSAQNSIGTLIFDNVLLSEGTLWFPADGYLTVSTSGVYYIGMFIETPKLNNSKHIQINLFLKTSEHVTEDQCSLWYMQLDANIFELAGRNCMLLLNENERLTVRYQFRIASLNDTSGISTAYRFSFHGFFYSQASGINIAWYVYSNTISRNDDGYMIFSEVVVNNNDIFNPSSNQVQ